MIEVKERCNSSEGIFRSSFVLIRCCSENDERED